MIDQFAEFEERELQIEIAARNVVAACREDRFGRGWRPKGLDEVAIVLESLGYSAEVIADLWYDSLFEFAADVGERVDKFITDGERREDVGTHWFVRACRDYATGALYSGPWIAAVIGLAVFGAALWSSLSTPLSIATAIALGGFGGLVASGTVAQMIGRRIAAYQLEDDPLLVSIVLERILGWSAAVFALLAVAEWLALRTIYGDPNASLAAYFFFGSALFQTSLAPLYALRRFASIALVSVAAILTTGLTFVIGFHRVVAVPSEPATLALEITVIGALVMFATLRWLRRREARAATVRIAPALRTIVASTLPYGAFGALYFLTIVVDHLAAGFGTGTYAYRSGYEFGTDVALVATIPIVGMINVAMESLPNRILGCATRGLGDIEPFDAGMARLYARCALGVVAMTALSVLLAEVVGPLVLERSVLGIGGRDGTEALVVMRYAAIAYGLLMLGLLNAQLLFTMSRPRAALAGGVVAVAVNAAVGATVVLAHLPTADCVFGLLGAVVAFVAITSVGAWRVVRDFTYHYYAAF
jgi:hypothetical protein